MHADGRIAGDGFRPGGGDGDGAGAVRKSVAHLPEPAPALLVLDLVIGKRRMASGAPVDDIIALIDKAVVVQLHKNLAHGGRKAFIHSEAQARPVHRSAHGADLVKDAVAVVFTPFPHTVNKSLAAQVLAAFALSSQSTLHHVLGGNARVVSTGNPKHILALLTGVTAEHVNERQVEGVADVQRAGDVGRRNDYGKRFARGIRVGREGFVFFPVLAPPGFHVMGLVALG